ncbi:MAG TPA: response regulator [Terriglobales bacterium]|nr:response regulator [Terriglobales bacterium]
MYDDLTGLRVRQLILEAQGYKVVAATSAQQGIEVFQSNPVDLVVADNFSREGDLSSLASHPM